MELLLASGADPTYEALPKQDEPFATQGGTAEAIANERLAKQGT